jgi:hypothetical protein
MNQYIITEEDICTIRDYILGAFYEGENKEKIYDLIKAEFSVIYSRPYQSERDKVLDDIETVINKTTSYISRNELEKKIAEHRQQAGEQE